MKFCHLKNLLKLSKGSEIKMNTNLYPLPDLNLPFLGLHFTPTGTDPVSVSIGPTATALWAEKL